nr:rifin PIR protein,putative [Plasmodium sp. DRC-Itaito]
MKLNYFKILLFFILLNILVTLYQAHNTNKPYITPHNTQSNRSLCECDTQSSNYNNDEDIKSVKERFSRQTSQRFEEYDERMKEKRQKRKEQRDKNVQDIIEKDKREKSLAEKVEIGCFRCGCALGGVAASVGIFGTVAVKELTKAAMATAAKEALKDAAIAAAGEAARISAFKSSVFAGIENEFGVLIQGVERFEKLFTASTYPSASEIASAINSEYKADSCIFGGLGPQKPICPWVIAKDGAARGIAVKQFSTYDSIEAAVKPIVSNAKPAAETAAQQATKEAIEASTELAKSAYAGCQTAIIASVVAIIIIALVMIIIYLVLRYRRKKKMNRKAEYTKLLKE